jgi:hypothetical protein
MTQYFLPFPPKYRRYGVAIVYSSHLRGFKISSSTIIGWILYINPSLDKQFYQIRDKRDKFVLTLKTSVYIFDTEDNVVAGD